MRYLKRQIGRAPAAFTVLDRNCTNAGGPKGVDAFSSGRVRENGVRDLDSNTEDLIVELSGSLPNILDWQRPGDEAYWVYLTNEGGSVGLTGIATACIDQETTLSSPQPRLVRTVCHIRKTTISPREESMK